MTQETHPDGYDKYAPEEETMTAKPEVLILADDRPTSVCDDLYQWSIDAEDALRSLHAENEDLRDTVQFVERWAVHHGTKGCMSATETLSAIQHYPGIAEVTDGYADGKRPATFNPYARIQELELEVVALSAQGLEQDAARYQALVESGNFAPSLFDNGMWVLRASSAPSTKVELDAAVDRVIAAQAKQGE